MTWPALAALTGTSTNRHQSPTTHNTSESLALRHRTPQFRDNALVVTGTHLITQSFPGFPAYKWAPRVRADTHWALRTTQLQPAFSVSHPPCRLILSPSAMHTASSFYTCFLNNYISSLRKKFWTYWQRHYTNREWQHTARESWYSVLCLSVPFEWYSQWIYLNLAQQLQILRDSKNHSEEGESWKMITINYLHQMSQSLSTFLKKKFSPPNTLQFFFFPETHYKYFGVKRKPRDHQIKHLYFEISKYYTASPPFSPLTSVLLWVWTFMHCGGYKARRNSKFIILVTYSELT